MMKTSTDDANRALSTEGNWVSTWFHMGIEDVDANEFNLEQIKKTHEPS
jgi:hypothetical protein